MNLSLKDLIDVQQFQMLQDRLNDIYPFPSAIIDNEGAILTATAWQDVCTKFHRINVECKKECIKSDQYIVDHISEADPSVSYKCPHGLVDSAAPIIIEGVHYGNFFTGQFFLDEPDLDFFRSQAKKYNFNESDYLEAVRKVPIRTHEQLEKYQYFIQGLIEVITGMGLKNLKEAKTRQQIRESEELHRSIIRTALDGFFLVDLGGYILETNESYCRMSGFSAQELTTMRITDLEAVESPEMAAAHMQRVIESGSERFETHHRRKDGSLYEVSVSMQYLPIQGGRVVAFMQEITDRRLAEEALRKSGEKFSLTFANAPVFMSLSDLDTGRFTEVNEEAMRMSGFSHDEMVGKTSIEIGWITPEDRARLMAILNQHGRVDGIELVLHAKGGRTVWVLYRGEVVTIAGRKQLLSTSIDITERKRIEEELRKTTSRLHLATASTKAGVWDWDLQTNEMIWDDRMLELYGLTAENFPGGIEAWTQGLHPEDSTRAIDECQAAIRGEREFDTEFRVQHPDGKILYIKADGHVLRNDQGIGIRMIGLNTDITERKLADEKLRRMEERLRQSEKMDAIGQLAGGIAHDFNNVLCGIIGYTEMSLGYAEKGSLLESNLLKVTKAADRAKNLVTQILAFSRKTNPQKLVTSLRPIIDEVLGLLKSSIPSSVIIASDLHTDTKPVLADPTQIHQALLNLATNAVHAMNRKGTLTVRLYPQTFTQAEISQSGEISPGEYAAVEIADSGCGMDNATLTRVFEPFFTTKPVGEGTGLGLSVVLGIVQSHGGYIQIDSTPGMGTTVRILLPISESSDPSRIDPNPKALLMGAERILFVDDEEMLVKMNLDLLTALGYTVTAMTDSRDALAFLRERGTDVDILITDQTMPGITGIELAQEARRIKKDFPIILCTGFSNEVDRQNAAALGISKFIMKPYRLHDISSAIREVFNEKK